MSTYVLIHGSWHGGWCWEKIARSLKRAGHNVETPDLPGHGDDETPISQISLRSYAERVCQVLDAQSEPVILVGHSMGGIAISQAAEYRPNKVETLVYLTGNLLRNGESLLQVAQEDKQSLVAPNLIIHEGKGVATIRGNAIENTFYGDCPKEDVARARSLLSPEPLAPLATPVSVTEENFGRIPRVYIELLRDLANSPSAQKRMYTALPCRKVISMNTSHSPFFSAPEELVAHLLSLRGGVRNDSIDKG
jgi:pimeloyl-ACP methyl ester carboxylesterase